MALQKPLTEEELQAQLGASQADEAEGCCVVFCKLVALVPVACAVIAELTGHKPPPGQLPFMSDCMDFIPTNWRVSTSGIMKTWRPLVRRDCSAGPSSRRRAGSPIWIHPVERSLSSSRKSKGT